MKIALCLSGQPRDIKIGFKFIEKYLIKPNDVHDIDIFCHAWYDPEEVGKSFTSAQQYPYGHVGMLEKDTDQYILNKIKPKKFLLEKQINFIEYVQGFKTHVNAKQDMLSSMFYSMFVCNNIKKEYEVENNFVYDLVVRTRYDIAYFEPIILSKYYSLLNKIIVPKNYQLDQDIFGSVNKPMPDIFSFSNSKNMDIFCSVYPNMKQINNKLDIPFAERYLGEWVRVQNNIQLECIDTKIVLLHRMPRRTNNHEK